MKKGFTLIELLIVVAIIAILAAIAVPNFLEAQVRAKVSRVRNDQRSLATALETYYVDNNTYPLFYIKAANMLKNRLANASATIPAGTEPAVQPNAASNTQRPTFATPGTVTSGGNTVPAFFALTTPVSYITSYFLDPFTNAGLNTFTYIADGPCWILVSYGPDADEPSNPTGAASYSDLVATLNQQARATGTAAETPFSCRDFQGTRNLLQTGSGTVGTPAGSLAFTYDPTNGTTSPGDVWRLKD